MAVIPPALFDRVVALGTKPKDELVYTATGFLLFYPTEHLNNNVIRGSYFLVTNKHVFEDMEKYHPKLYMRFNMPVKPANMTSTAVLKQNGLRFWVANQHADVAVLQIGPTLHQKSNNIIAFVPGCNTITSEQARKTEISEGVGVFVLGFPLGHIVNKQNHPTVRHGVIAGAQDWLQGNSRTFLIDATIFPGFSGSPVFTRPEFGTNIDTKPHSSCSLIGIASSYTPYQDIAISRQTGQDIMLHQENSGLSIIESYDSILETVRNAIENT